MTELLDVLQQVLKQATDAAHKIRITSETSNHYPVMLYFTLVELAGSVLIVLSEKRTAGVSAIARSALDAFVDIKILMEHPSHCQNLDAADTAQWKKTLQAASGTSNPFLFGLAQDPGFAKYRKFTKRKRNSATSGGGTQLSVEARFIKAGLNAEYELYSFLSAEAHNNVSFLRHNHMSIIDGELVVALHAQEAAFVGSIPLILCEMIMYSSEWLHEKYGTGHGSVRGIRAMVEPIQQFASKSRQ